MANTNSLTTNLATSPYYDDFDPTKNYVRILFKPSLAVQARELTQLQTALQKQIDYNAEHFFKEGALVRNGKLNVDFDLKYVKVNDLDTSNNSLNVSELMGTSITSANTGVKAIVVDYADGSEASDPNTKVLFIKYQSSSPVDGITNVFNKNEIITSNSGVTFSVYDANNCVGNSASATITDGVLFAKDHFIYFPPQTLVIDKFKSNPTVRIGFDLIENIVNSDGDPTLLDPASGTTNYAAPGADRIKITPTLVAYENPEDITEDFVELANIVDGVIQSIVTKTEYSVIADEFARRTYDESGNYFVKGLTVNMREHLNDGTNFGLLSSADGGNSSLLAIGVEPGKAYVYGYEVEKLVTQYIPIEKGIDSKPVESQSISANYGNYLLVNELVGSANLNDGINVALYDEAERRISSNKYSSTSPTGAQIGTATLKSLEYQAGNPGANTAQYRAYLTNINMTSSAFSNVKAIYYNNSANADVCMDVIESPAILQEKAFNSHVYLIPTQNTKTIRDENGDTETVFEFKKSFDVSIASTGTFTINTSSSNEIFPFGAGPLNSTQKNNNFILSLNTAATVSLTGTVSGLNGASTLTGSGTQFTSQLNVGDKIKVGSDVRTIVSIGSNVSLTISSSWSTDHTAESFVKQYSVGDVINLNGIGANGTARSVTINSATSASFDLKEGLSGTISASVVTNLSRTNATEIKKIKRRNRLVQIDCSTHSATNAGPWDLGFSDVIKINSVRKKSGSDFTTTSEGTDVTGMFQFDNGQRDDIYDHATLRKLNSASVGSADRLLVDLDYFYHDMSQGVGYLSVDSYPVDDVNGAANNSAITTSEIPIFTSPTTGRIYNLRDSIDTRNVKIATATDATVIGSASKNPAKTDTLSSPTGGIRTPTPNSNFEMDYSYYLPRKDLIVIDSKGLVKSIRGIPSLTPGIPALPADSMTFAELEIAPYPSLPPLLAANKKRPQYANRLRNVAIKRYTMEQIGQLEKRIENLEYYTALNFLEKATLDLKVLDDQGLDRFKNGILVDPFDDHSIGDTNNPDYKIAVDRAKSEIRPSFEIDSVGSAYVSGSGITKTGNLITLPFTSKLAISQPYAATTRNAAGLFYTYKGSITLSPDSDYWTDTNQVPDLQITNDNDLSNWQNLANAWGTDWGDWQTNWTSTNVSASTGQVSSTTNNGGQIATTTTTTKTTTTTTTSGQSRTGTQLNVGSSTTTQNYGDRVIDTSVVPFMRPRAIYFTGHGFKSNTRLYATFDGEMVTNYITPMNSSFVATGSRGSALVTDGNGNVYGLFNLPNDDVMKFRTGTKLFRLNDNAQGLTAQGLSTTYGEAPYTASGLNQVKQGTIVSTVNAIVTPVTVYDSKTTTTSSTSKDVSVSTTVTVPIPPPPPPVVIVQPAPPPVQTPVTGRSFGGSGHFGGDPIAQTFSVVTPEGIPGMFFTKLDVYFASKHPIYGAEVEIRELNSGNYLTKNVVPYSKVRLPSSSMNISADGSVATTFTFSAPIFLLADTDYAFVVRPEALNDLTNVWVSKLGEKDIASQSIITKQPYTGVLFASSNDGTWESIQDEDIKFNLYRAAFTTGYGSATFANEATEYLSLDSIGDNFTETGEEIRGLLRGSLSSISGGSVSNNDIVVGQSSGTRGNIRFIDGSNNIKVGITTTNKTYTSGENVSVLYANGSSKGVSGYIATSYYPTATLKKFYVPDAENIFMEIIRTNNYALEVGEEIRGQTSNAYATIGSFLDKKMNLINIQSSEINLSGTSVEWMVATTSNSHVVDSNFTIVQHNGDYYLPEEKLLMSKTNELNSLSGQKSLQLRSRLFTSTEYISPVVDASRCHTIFVHNIVNNDATGEDQESGGNAITRYITQKVTLADGQDSEDVKVYVTGYRPIGSDIKLYFKALNANDSNIFEDIAWQPLEMTSKNLFSSSENKEDFKEFEYSIPEDKLTGGEGQYQYVNKDGITYTGYKYFAIKIVLLSDNSVTVPRCRDMRALCLQR